MLGSVRKRLNKLIQATGNIIDKIKPGIRISIGINLKQRGKQETKEDDNHYTPRGKTSEPSTDHYVSPETWYEATIQDERLLSLGSDEIIPDSYASPIPFDLRCKYWFLAKVQGIDTSINEPMSGWFSVEDDELHTQGEWLDLLSDCVGNSPFGYSLEIEKVIEIKLLKRENPQTND